MTSTCNTDVFGQLSQFWSMLDDLSENDPAAYRKLTEDLQTGGKHRVQPALHSTVCTQTLEPQTGLLYINICSWNSVPEPQDPNGPLPMCAGTLETGTKEGWYAVLDVAFNPAALRGTKEVPDINKVYSVALSFAQQRHGMRLSQEYTVVSCSPKSRSDDLHRRLGSPMQSNSPKQPETASLTPAALLKQISSLQSEKRDENSTAQIIFGSEQRKKKALIQVVSSTLVEPERPEYHLQVKSDAAGVPRSVELTVELPKVRSVSECQLSVSEEDVLLQVEDVYYLLLDLPEKANGDTASAIFNKKTRRLTMKVDLLIFGHAAPQQILL
ncbi:PIH1 domain-containing protein 2 isoform X2 [Oryzias melastigma]|uniref:PIH1 domain-containing protein 2 isoform X2 n=1 Tax=Oryzias melastigma TaxID=30732 RepID=UPI000CF7D536|nr:PIH1 domain-containing protein 2 isoform X2 [Oryzias melastigma]